MRRSLRLIGFVLTGIIAVVCLALIVSQTPWFRGWARAYIVRSSDRFLNGELTIGRLEGNLFTGAVLTDFAITMDGERVIYARRAEIDYNLNDLLSEGVVIDRIRLFEPEIVVRRDARGLNLGRLIKSRPRDPKGRQRTVTLSDIEITDGVVTLHGVREIGPFIVPGSFTDFDARLVYKHQPDRSTLNLTRVSAVGANPSLPIRALGGTLAFGDGDMHFADLTLATNQSNIYVDGVIEEYLKTATFKLVARGTPWSFPELEGVVPFIEPYDLAPRVEARLEGPASRLVIDLDMTSEAGAARGVLIGDFVEPERRLEGDLRTSNLNLARLYSDPDLKSDIDGRARFNLALLRGDVPVAGTWRFEGPAVELMGYRATDVEASGRVNRRRVEIASGRANAYGGFATAAGVIQFADARGRGLAVDLRGRATNVNLRTLPVTVPVPRLVTDLNLTAYHMQYDDSGFVGEATLAESVVEGARYAAGTRGMLNTRGVTRYSAEGRVAGLDLLRYGRALELDWLADPRLAGALNGTFAIEGRGETLETLALSAKGTLTDSTIFGGTLPAMTYAATILDRRLTLDADGAFRGFDGAALTGNQAYKGVLNGLVKGRVEVLDLTRDITLEGVAFDGLAALEASTIGGLRIDRATLDGFFTGRVGEIRRFDITGPELTASASGHLDLTPAGQTKLAFTAETSDLSKVGQLIGQPVSGAGAVKGTLTGNSTELRAEGTFDGSGVGYNEYTAANLDATFAAVIPNLDYTRATGTADIKAAMIDAGAIDVAEVNVRAAYDGTQFTFDGTALQAGGRQMAAAGRAVLHPDHKEIHLSAFTIAAGDQKWSLEGGDAAIQYGRGQLVLNGVTLVSGASRVSATGVLPLDAEGPVGPLRLNVVNVDLAALEPLLMTDYGLAGTLNADAVVTGTLKAPRADGKLLIQNGAIRGYTFQSLEGSVDYGERAIAVDVRLQQNPTEYLTAVGTIPISAIRAAGSPGEHVETGEQMNLHIESSPIQLTIIQAFTPYVTNVTGFAQANVTVTGTVSDPHLVGVIAVKGGAFEVPELGTEYTGLDTQLEFTGNVMRIQSFTLVDGNGEIMRVGGELSMHERQLGTFQVNVETQNFEIIDNRLGDVQITSLIALTGTLAQPRLIGTVELEAARVEVDRVFDFLGGNVYALTPQADLPAAGTTFRTREEQAVQQAAEAEARQAQAVAAGAAHAPGENAPLFDRLAMDVRVIVPNNLVLRGDDIRPSGPESVAIGDLNVTVGGDVTLRKAPQAQTRITGLVNTVRGTYDFQGRRFEVEREGAIRFLGTEDINPLIDISATRDISGVLARVHLRGTLREPTLTLTSDPPLDEADILSLIIFNRPINQIGNEERGFLTDVAANYAAGIFTEQLSQSLGRALDLDLFEIQTTTAAGEVTPRITVGQQFGDRLFMRFSQQFGSQQVSEFTLEYELTDFLRLAGTVAEGRQSAGQRLALRRVERYGLDLVFFFSY